jgi:hypothetical protein
LKKVLLIGCLALALSACRGNEEAQAIDDGETETTEYVASDVPLADSELINGLDNEAAAIDAANEVYEAEVENQMEEEEKSRLLEFVNPNANNDLYVFRDKATGCEFIQVQNDYAGGEGRSVAVVPRPDGKGRQRGCGKGTDF